MKRGQKSAKLVVLDNDDPITAETEEIQARIRRRAFELSQARPRDANEIYDWMAAESQVISVPPAELLERDGIFDVKFAVAGVDPDDVNIMVSSDRILLKSQYTHRHDAESGNVILCDFKSSTVFRSIHLPQPIDVSSVAVDFEDGMVHVSAAKEGSAGRPKSAAATRKAPAKKSRAKQP